MLLHIQNRFRGRRVVVAAKTREGPVQVITLEYAKTFINEATQKYNNATQEYNDALERLRLENLSTPNSAPQQMLAYPWMDEVVKWGLIAIPVAMLISIVGELIYRLIAGEDRKHAGLLTSLGGAIMSTALTFVVIVVLADMALDGFDKGPYADDPVAPEKPDYEAALAQTVNENRGDIDLAIGTAAKLAGIDLEEACETGQSSGPGQRDSRYTAKGNKNLLQCGGDEFGALLYADLDAGVFRTISTSTGAKAFKVITNASDSEHEHGAVLSSVSFLGVSETKYEPKSGASPWPVDEADRAEGKPGEVPYEEADEMTLEAALEAVAKKK